MADIIYEPRRAALEYARLVCNHYHFCAHGCSYCFARGIFRKDLEMFRTTVELAKDWKALCEDASDGVSNWVADSACFTFPAANN